MHGSIPDDVKSLLADFETFISDILKGENLSKKAKDKKEVLIKKIKDIKASYPQEFQDKVDSDDGEDYEDPLFGPHDSCSLASDRGDREEETPLDGNQFPPIAAQDLPFVLKGGYLEKRRKDKQQKGEFAMEGYTVKMNNTLRKDAKKDCCFEISAHDKRIYQFAAATPKEAEDWIQQIKFLLQDMESDTIPEDHEEKEVGSGTGRIGAYPPPISTEPIDDDIYEELPEDDEKAPGNKEEFKKMRQDCDSSTSGNKNDDYGNFYQGLWDCSGDHPDELSFKRGDAIYIISKEYNKYGWWVGEMKGAIGLVPKTYIMEMYDI